MAYIVDGICPEGFILDGLADWPASTTRKEWFRLTRELVQQTIADMDLDPAAMAQHVYYDLAGNVVMFYHPADALEVLEIDAITTGKNGVDEALNKEEAQVIQKLRK